MSDGNKIEALKQISKSGFNRLVTHKARCISSPARSWIAKDLHPKVLHVFSQAVNLINEEGEILSLVTGDVDPAPFAIVIEPRTRMGWSSAGFTEWIEGDSNISCSDGHIAVGKIVVDFGETEVWDPQLNYVIDHTKLLFVSRLLPEIIEILERTLAPSSFAGILEQLIAPQPVLDEPRDLRLGDRFLAAALNPARTLCLGLKGGDLSLSRQAARKLAGLGIGLTPAGDDFLLGAFLGHHLFDVDGKSSRFLKDIVDSLVGQTNALSMALLRSAANAEASIGWHELFGSIERESHEQLLEACRKILTIGNSSGADALTGFVTTLSWLQGE